MNDLLRLALTAHGGLDNWNALSALYTRVSLTGLFYGIKGQAQGMQDVLLSADTHSPVVTVSPFGSAGTVGHFTAKRVWIMDGANMLVEARDEPRLSFTGHVLTSTWDRLQLLYFNSYAMWNYLATPFLFATPGFELSELSNHQENGDVWRRLHVKYPPDIPTHCAEQLFYFNNAGLLQRIDYTTEVAGGIAAHYCYDHRWFSGILFPTLRRVVRRTAEGAHPAQATMIRIEIADIQAERR